MSSTRSFVRLFYLMAILSICFAASGKVKWFNPARGFGFISNDSGGPDVFVHFTKIISAGFRALANNQRVTFDVINGVRGLEAANVRVV